MNKRKKSSTRYFGLICALALVGCSGDGRPLQESVETNQLALTSISIMQPANLLNTLVLSPGDQISFAVQGVSQFNEIIPLSSNDRRWSVDNGIASIDESGNFIALQEGTVNVGVQIGGLAARLPVNISVGTLVSINEIVGADTIERCIPANFSATGVFSDQSTRALPNVNWSFSTNGLGLVGAPGPDGVVPITGINVGDLGLIAEVDGIVSEPKSVVIEDTLQSIIIDPESLALVIDDDLTLTAIGVYFENGTERRVGISDNVFWIVPPGNGVVSVSNTAPNIGVVSAGDEAGSTRIAAACGTLQTERSIVVVEDDDDLDDT